jgi:cell shape-determining protein MreC
MLNYYKITRYLVLTALLAFVFLLDFLGFLTLTNLRSFIANWQARNYQVLLNLTQPVAKLRQFWQLRQKLEDLEYRYRESSVQLTELESLREENKALKNLLENTDRSLEKNLIAKPISSFAKPVLAIDEDSGVQIGSVVLGEGSLLGLIESFSHQQARVLLLKDMFDKGIVAKTESGAKGIVKGDGKNILFVEISSEASLNLRERVVTVGQEGIAADIFIARVASLRETDQEKATQEAVLEQDVNFHELSLVEVQR